MYTNIYIPKFEISISWFCQLIPVVVVMKKWSKIYIILVCKILIDDVMVVKIGKIVCFYSTCTYHIWNLYLIYFSKYTQQCFFFMKKRSKIHIILVCKLYIYRAMDLKLGMLVYIIIQHILVHFQVPIAWTYAIMADFVIFYNKNGQKLSTFWSVKYTFWKPML